MDAITIIVNETNAIMALMMYCLSVMHVLCIILQYFIRFLNFVI